MVRLGAEKVNELYKGYCPSTLASELNKLELEKYSERKRSGKEYLKRHYHCIPENIEEYEVPQQPSGVSYNLHDSKSVFYRREDDTLYLSATRCCCDVCLEDSFLNCKSSNHHIHRYSMKKIQSRRTYPTPSKENFIPFAPQGSTHIKEKDTIATRIRKRANVKKTATVETDSETQTCKDNLPKSALTDWQVIRQNMLTLEQSVSFEMIERPVTSKRLICQISETESKEAKKQWKSFAISFPYEDMSFKPHNEYELGSVSHIIQRFKSSEFQSHGPIMNRQSEAVPELINPATFLTLIKIYLSRPNQTFSEWMNNVKDQLSSNFLPSLNFENLIICLFCTEGMKKRFLKGEFAYDQTASPGHFVTLKLNMKSSSLQVYDSMNTDIRKSQYFDYPLVLTIINFIYCHHKLERNQPIEKLRVFQQKLQRQSSVDCGAHSLINMELLIKNKDPAVQMFNDEIIGEVRKYHYLLNESSINELRLQM